MKALRWHGKRDIRYEEVPEPSPGPGEVKLKVLWAGICGSDVHEYESGPVFISVEPNPLTGRMAPLTIGHEFSARVVELGAGAADKTRAILDAMHDAVEEPVYVPVDISGEFLEEVAASLRQAYPAARVRPLVADITAGPHLPDDLPRPVLFALLGGTIGNFPRDEGVELIRRVRSEMRDADRFLVGFDLQKDVATLEAAYNDAAGVTAAFNLNVLRVLNRELGADFDPRLFRHRAVYVAEDERIEMHLVAQRPCTVAIPDVGSFHFEAGESVRTEVSCKYNRPSIEALFGGAGLDVERYAVAPPGFALALGRPL